MEHLTSTCFDSGNTGFLREGRVPSLMGLVILIEEDRQEANKKMAGTHKGCDGSKAGQHTRRALSPEATSTLGLRKELRPE